MRHWLALGLTLLSCTTKPAAPPAGASGAAEPKQAEPAEPAKPTTVTVAQKLDSCKAVGPIACDMTPRPIPAWCKPSTSCLRTTADAPSVEDLSIQCDIDLGMDTLEDAFSRREPAPHGSGVLTTTVMNLRSTEDGISRFDASYLIADLAEGSCLVDFVHDWEMSRLVRKTMTHASWSETPEGPRLLIESDRVLYDEPDEGQADDELHCERLSYRVVAGRFTPLGRESLPGPCRANLPNAASGRP